MSPKENSYGNRGAFKYFIEHDYYKISIVSLYIMLFQINHVLNIFYILNTCVKDNKRMNLLVNDKKYCKNIVKHGIKLKTYLRKNLVVNQCIMIVIIKLK